MPADCTSDDDASSRGVLHLWQAKLEPKIDDGDHFAAQIDDTLHIRRCLRYRGDVLNSHNLADLEYLYGELFAAQQKSKVFAAAPVDVDCASFLRSSRRLRALAHLLRRIAPRGLCPDLHFIRNCNFHTHLSFISAALKHSISSR
jgi:hypothetical protein